MLASAPLASAQRRRRGLSLAGWDAWRVSVVRVRGQSKAVLRRYRICSGQAGFRHLFVQQRLSSCPSSSASSIGGLGDHLCQVPRSLSLAALLLRDFAQEQTRQEHRTSCRQHSCQSLAVYCSLPLFSRQPKKNRVRPGFEYPHPDASKLKYSFSFLCYSVLIPIQPRIIRSTIRIDHHCDGTPKAAQISPRGSSSFSAATVFNASSSTALY
jgi:hypothetical protein